MKDFARPPLERWLTWPPRNYVNPSRDNGYVVPATVVITMLSVFAVACRFWARGVLLRKIGADDWFMLVALVLSIGQSVVIIFADKCCDLGVHAWDFDISKGPLLRKLIWVAEWFYVFASFFARISVLVFYRRINAGGCSTRFLWATWTGIIYNIMFTLHIPLFLFLICRPFDAFWLANDYLWVAKHRFTCGREDIGLIMNGALSTGGDIYTALVPIFLVKNLHMSGSKKLRLYALFSTGFLVVAAGSMRTVEMVRLVTTYDTTWRLPLGWFWAVLECNITIIAGSVPAMKPLVVKVIGPAVSRLGGYFKRYGPNDNDTTSGDLASSPEVRQHIRNRRSAHMFSILLSSSEDTSGSNHSGWYNKLSIITNETEVSKTTSTTITTGPSHLPVATVGIEKQI